MVQRKTVFVTGGARSGKSRFAQAAAEALGVRRVFLATAQALDQEMADRIARHKAERGPDWRTCEAPFSLPDAVREHAGQADVMLIDCVTLWVSNLLLRHGAAAVGSGVHDLCGAVAEAPCNMVIVSNEVGCGIVPDNALAREFRDLAGMANRLIAAACSDVFLMAAGLPQPLKQSGRPCGMPDWLDL
jgi:adenosylcobinamide kinase/adenosylcobinamide-phosphate guanylyltransferase